MNGTGASWRTSVLAWVGVLSAVLMVATALLDGDPATTPNFEAITAALTAAGIGFFARDNKVSSKSAGAE